jgi:hypothetical protein
LKPTTAARKQGSRQAHADASQQQNEAVQTTHGTCVQRRAQLVRDAGQEGALQRKRGVRVCARAHGGVCDAGAEVGVRGAAAQQRDAHALCRLVQKPRRGRLAAGRRVHPQPAHGVHSKAEKR